MKHRISIVIPTYKRKKHLLYTLDSLKGKISNTAEVIIVEQVNNNKKSFLDRAEKLGLNVQYYFLSNPSTSHAKNVGALHAKGDIIVFFDDDILLKTKLNLYIEDLKGKKVAAVTGRSVAVGQNLEPNRKDTGRITFMGKFSDGYSSTISQEIDTVIGCNAAWSKTSFNKIGGFDEQFTGNAIREESDLSLRAKELGYKILFDPKVEIEHVRAESGGARKTEGRLQWYFDFFSNETYFFLKHRPFLLVPVILLTRLEWAFRCMFGFGREVSIKSMITPISGVFNGYEKYRKCKNENRC